MKKPVAFIIASALFVSTFSFTSTAEAQSLDHNYVEANVAFYPSYGGGPRSQDYAGWRFRGAFQVIPEAFVFGQYRFLTDDIDYTQAHLGAAYLLGVARQTDIYAGPSMEFMGFSPGPDEVGFGFRGGVRHRINPEMEFGVEVRYVTIGGRIDTDYVGATGTFQYHIATKIGLTGEIDVEDGEVGFLAGARINL